MTSWRLAVAPNLHLGGRPRRHLRDLHLQLVGSFDGLAIQCEHHIALLEAGLCRWRIGRNVADQNAAALIQPELLGETRRHVLNVHAQIAAHDFAVLDDLVHDVARHVDRNCEADALVAAALARENRRVDADQAAVKVDQRAAGIAGIDRGVGLNEILVVLDAEAAAPVALTIPMVAVLPMPNGSPMARTMSPTCILEESPIGKCGQTGGIDLYHCHVRLRIGADRPFPGIRDCR